MVNVWVVEAFEYVRCKLTQFFHRKVERFHQFFKLHFMDIFTDNGVVTSIAYDIDAAQVCYRAQNGMWAIEERHFALMIRFLRLCNQYM